MFGPSTFINNGALGAAAGTMNITSTNWSGTGNVDVTGGTLNLGGTFTTNGWTAGTHSAGAINVTGTLTNTSSTLNIGTTGIFGNLGLTSLTGTVTGGTLITSGGVNLPPPL